MATETLKQEPTKSSGESTRTRERLITGYLVQLQTALGQDMKPERLNLYLRALADLNEDQLGHAFKHAVLKCKFIPTIAELREWANEFARSKHQKQAQARTKALLDRPDKPDDWSFKLDSAWEEIERRRDEQEAKDLAFVETFTDEEILAVMASGKPYPAISKQDRYVDWIRRREARARRAAGISRPRARTQLEPLFQTLVTSTRQPGDGTE